VANLALQADAGIGSAGAIQVVGPINVAFTNATSGNVQINSTGALTIAAVDGVSTSANSAAGGTLTLTAASPITFAVNTTSSGTITVTTTETATETTTSLPPPDDDITVNAGVTVESTAGDVNFTAGDSITMAAGSVVQSDTGALTFKAGIGDVDNDAVLNLLGTLSSSTTLTLQAPGDITIGTINAPGQTVTITSTNGAILDGNDPPDGALNITAGSLALSAFTGIGGPGTTATIETQVSNLEAQTTTGGIFINNGVTSAVTLNVGGVTASLNGVQVTGASGDIELTNNGSINVTTAGDVIQGPGNITLTTGTGGTFTATMAGDAVSTTGGNITINTDNVALNAGINAGSNVVQLQPVTGGMGITLGATTAGTLSILQSDLNNVTAGVLRIGDFNITGNITVAGSISEVGTGWTTLSLLTAIGGGISENAGATLTMDKLNAAGNTGVSLMGDNAVNTVAGATESGAFTFNSVTGLMVDNVDPTLGFGFGSGIITQAQPVKINANNNTLMVNQPIDTTQSFGGPASSGADITLIANNMALNNNSPSSTINGGTSGRVTLAPFTTTETIDVGGPDGPGVLGIDNNDLTNITASVVQIGGPSVTGNINVSAAVHPALTDTLTLITTGGIGGGGTVTVKQLALTAGNGVNLTGANSVGTLAGSVTSAGQGFSFSNAGTLTVGTVDGAAGITTNNGGVTVNTNGDLTILNNISAGTSPVNLTSSAAEGLLTNSTSISGLTINLTADRMALEAGTILDGPPNTVTLQPFTSGRPIVLGTVGDPIGSLSLSNAELATITAGTLVIQSAGTAPADMVINSLISQAGSHYTSLTLIANRSMTITPTGAVAGSNNAGTLTFVVDNSFPNKPLFGAGEFLNRGSITGQDRIVVFAVSPDLVDLGSLSLPTKGFGIYFGDSLSFSGNGIVFKIEGKNFNLAALNAALAGESFFVAPPTLSDAFDDGYFADSAAFFDNRFEPYWPFFGDSAPITLSGTPLVSTDAGLKRRHRLRRSILHSSSVAGNSETLVPSTFHPADDARNADMKILLPNIILLPSR
jgi:hypothetical protein